jgi:hypothetical protein
MALPVSCGFTASGRFALVIQSSSTGLKSLLRAVLAGRREHPRRRTVKTRLLGAVELRDVALPPPQRIQAADRLARQRQPQPAFANWHRILPWQRESTNELECHLLPLDHRCADYCYSCSTTLDGGANQRERNAYHDFRTIDSGFRALALDGNIDAFYHSCYILSDANQAFCGQLDGMDML